MLWDWTENVFCENKKRPVLRPPSWGCLSSRRSWRGKQRPHWQGLVGIVKESWVFPMKMANCQDIVIPGTEERNWELFVYLRWESVLGTQEDSLLITAHLHIQIEAFNGETFTLIGFSSPREKGVLQHQWSQQKGDWELVCPREAQAPRLQT